MKEWFFGLEARERRVLVGGGVIAVLALVYVLVLEPLYGDVAKLRQSVREKTALLDWMERTAATLPDAGGTQPGTGASGQWVSAFNRQANRAGLSVYLRETRPNGSNGVRARFEGVPFDELVRLLGALEPATGLRVVNASVERGQTDGTINARITLVSGSA